MNLNCYFGVRSLEAVIKGIRSMDTKAQIALFACAGVLGYGYLKYGRKKKAKKENNQLFAKNARHIIDTQKFHIIKIKRKGEKDYGREQG